MKRLTIAMTIPLVLMLPVLGRVVSAAAGGDLDEASSVADPERPRRAWT
jgi:hypothetical protein